MKVQRVLLPDTNRPSWLVLDNEYLPIAPILTYLKFLEDLGRSPYTIRAFAHHLKVFWEYLRDEHLEWVDVDVEHLAGFIAWLRRPQPALLTTVEYEAQRTNATIDQMLTAVHGLYDHHARLHTGPELALYRFLGMPRRRYKPFLYGIAKVKPIRTRLVKVKREQRLVKTLTQQQVQQLIAACGHLRDKFLLTLLYDTGMRIGQALGLRHADLKPEDNEIHIVPREDNSNGARAKAREPYTIPVSLSLMQLYTDYLVTDLNGLEVEQLPDYVFVNLWEGEIGRPMTYDAVISLFHRLEQKTGIQATPHMLRHTRATVWLRDDQLPLATVSRLLGHASIQTTHDTYIHLTPQDLKRDLERARKGRGDRT